MITPITEVEVGLDFGSEIQPVGRLAIRDRIIYFEYDDALIQQDIEISPLRLPLQRGLIELPQRPFEGLAVRSVIACLMVGDDCSLTVC